MSMLIALVLCGTCGFVLVEGWSLFDSFYMTVITLSTVGYGETNELSETGRLFTMFLIFGSMICVACWTAGITSLIVGGDMSGAFLQRRNLKMISQLFQHTVVCGSGLMAQTLVDKLVRSRQPVAILSNDTPSNSQLRKIYPSVPVIEGNPTSEMALFDANVLNAKYVVAALDSDYDNLLIAITCKGLGTDVKVLARADSADLASRMLKIGVDQVISPFELGGNHAAQLIATH
jgi:voltage-gated potassium channel